MENKILKNELNLGESGFYLVRMEFAKDDMPINWFNVTQFDEGAYITDISYGSGWEGNPEIIYTTSNDFHLSNTETFKTKEQALQYAKELNSARVYNNLTDLMRGTNFLIEKGLLDLEDRFVGFLMEINARFNAFEKTQYPTEENKKLREQVNKPYEILGKLKELLFIDYNPTFKTNYLGITNITEEHKYFKTIKDWLEGKE